jgi:maleate cis-trans isomerase
MDVRCGPPQRRERRPAARHRQSDVYAFAFTTGSFFRGPGGDREIAAQIDAEKAVI